MNKKQLLFLMLFAGLSKNLAAAAASDAPAGGAGLPIPRSARDCCLLLQAWKGKPVEIGEKGAVIELENVFSPVLDSSDPINTVKITFKVRKDGKVKNAEAIIHFLSTEKVERIIQVDCGKRYDAADVSNVDVDKNFWFDFCSVAGELAFKVLMPGEKLGVEDRAFIKDLVDLLNNNIHTNLQYEDCAFEIINFYSKRNPEDFLLGVMVEFSHLDKNMMFEIAIEDDSTIDGVLVKFFIFKEGGGFEQLADGRYKIAGRTQEAQAKFIDELFTTLRAIAKP
jgi:hypothetical protein